MGKAPVAKGTVIQLNDVRRPPPLVFSSARQAKADEVAKPAALDLTAARKFVMVVGRGRVGKSTFLRWLAERALERGPLSLVAADVGHRTLVDFFGDDVMVPAEGTDIVEWLRLYLKWLAEQPSLSAAADFGGDNPYFMELLDRQPGLVLDLHEQGIEAVLGVMFGPAEEEASILDKLDAREFYPSAIALLLNLGMARDIFEFSALRANPVYKAALDRGAVEIEMPRNYAAKVVDDWRLGYKRAADKEKSPLSFLDRGPVQKWLDEMEKAFAPIASWLP